jgi:hypothetical protein
MKGIPINLMQVQSIREAIKATIDTEHISHDKINWKDLLKSTEHAISLTCHYCGRATGGSRLVDGKYIPTCCECNNFYNNQEVK